MKTIILIIGLVLSVGSYAQTQADIKDKNWYLTKLEIENQEYLRPINEEANSKTSNFYYESDDMCWTGFCYGFQLADADLNEEEQILLVERLATLAFPQDCDLEENNDFDHLNFIFGQTEKMTEIGI